MLERLPARVRTASVARAVTSPSGILLAGAGTSAAILAGLPVAGAALVGAGLWALRVAAAVPRGPRQERIDPFAVGEPWRRFVQDALQAQARFDRTVRRTAAGPLRDRLALLGERIGQSVRECWRIAVHGDNLDGALRQLDVEGIRRDLAEIEHEQRRSGPSPSLEQAERSVRAQLASAERVWGVARDAHDRLRLLNAQLDEAVARAIELSVHGGDLDPLTGDVENLVSELEALRQALEETRGTPAA